MMVGAFLCAHASLVGTGVSSSVKRVTTVEEASKYLRSAIKGNIKGAARCLVVPNALNNEINKNKVMYCGLPTEFEAREIHMCDSCIDFDEHVEISAALRLLGEAHRTITGDTCSRGRVARISGTPCPKIHVDRVRLRILATLRGPGVVLHPDDENREQEIRTDEGDVVFMRGVVSEKDQHGILHRSPPREQWMSDRVIVQVDDW